MKPNYVLIDYENVQPEVLALLDHEHFQVIVFVGANQTKVTFEVTSGLQRMGERADYIKIAGNGPNALDFHIAFYIGHLASQHPDACFHIVSKDAGFDPLVQHLKGKKISVSRTKDVSEIKVVKAANLKSSAEKIAAIVNDLQKRGVARPRTIKTLSGTIDSLFRKQLANHEIASLVATLEAEGLVVIDGNKASYRLPQ